MTVLVRKEWLKTYGGAERLGREKGSVNWATVHRYGWLLAIAFITVFFFIWQNLSIIGSGYEIEKLKGKLNELQTQNSLLTVEAASLSNLLVVEQRATYELGMVRPAPGQVIYPRISKSGKGHDQPQGQLTTLGQ